MDIQRYALLIALALVGWMTLVEWNTFRLEHLPAAEAPAGIQGQSPALQSPPAADISAPAVAQTTSDLPEAHAPAAVAQPAAKTQSDTISVVTDTLQLEISLIGGDIVGAALPKFHAELGREDLPFKLLQQNTTRNYTAQSGLVGSDGTDTAQGRPRFSSAKTSWAMADGENSLVVALDYRTGTGVAITKRYTFTRGSYVTELEYTIDNHSAKPWQAGLFGQLRRDDSPDPSATGGSLGIKPFVGFASRTSEEHYLKHKFDSLGKEPYSAQTTGGWIALVQHYFVSAWIPVESQTNRIDMLRSDSGFNIARFTSPSVSVAPGASASLGARFYAGPKDQYKLFKISPGLDLTVDYGWLWWIAQPLFALLTFFATGKLHAFGSVIEIGSGVGNWGAAIVLLTLLVKGAFFHLSAASYRSMAKMRKLQPKMLELRERHGDDRQKLSQETMDLYRREKVNPLGGCLPILIQMPVFLSLYWVLLESVELRQAPLGGWIHDLSVMDPYFVLPLLMGASMFYQQKLNPPPPDPMQAKVMQFMPIIFTVFFLFFPAGLVLYWLVNNLLSISQQWVITRQIEREN